MPSALPEKHDRTSGAFVDDDRSVDGVVVARYCAL